MQMVSLLCLRFLEDQAERRDEEEARGGRKRERRRMGSAKGLNNRGRIRAGQKAAVYK